MRREGEGEGSILSVVRTKAGRASVRQCRSRGPLLPSFLSRRRAAQLNNNSRPKQVKKSLAEVLSLPSVHSPSNCLLPSFARSKKRKTIYIKTKCAK
ncbi:hypothetical protein Pcinc_033865 [Petrolisthes cinctipes]|uniref:Uncharacterized protein n=1 Tax=Petrolisthes cinctipes TaxID=88211 RepID=A0AAE1ERI9_PETCI|nr:hypothetical protein Pcinc_033865 [Petrolisthes cinctipes]